MSTKDLKVKCPTCNKEIIWADVPTRPFCSDRCRLIDLGEWAEEKYSLPDEHSRQTEKSEDEDSEN